MLKYTTVTEGKLIGPYDVVWIMFVPGLGIIIMRDFFKAVGKYPVRLIAFYMHNNVYVFSAHSGSSRVILAVNPLWPADFLTFKPPIIDFKFENANRMKFCKLLINAWETLFVLEERISPCNGFFRATFGFDERNGKEMIVKL